MKGFKKFLLYFVIILGCIVTIGLIVVAFMFFSPNTSVLGFQYVSCNEQYVKEYTTSTDPSISSTQAFEISTENSDIYIYPNSESDSIKIDVLQKHSGFAKTINSQLNTKVSAENKSFEENEAIYRTFKITFDEPSGWISTNKSRIIVYLPTNLSLNTIYAKSENGNVYYNSTLDETNLSCTNLYLKSFGSGKIEITNTQSISNYYLYTENSSVNFANSNSIVASQILFETKKGSLSVVNDKGDATLNSALIIKSEDSKKGPTVSINNLNGNLTANINNGTISINNIGSKGNYKTIAISSNKSQLNFGTVYGKMSVLSNSQAEKNIISIDKLYSSVLTNQYELGAGKLQITTELDGNVSVESTSGSISILKASVTSSIYAYTLSGDININYNYSLDNNKDTSLKVVTNTGNINLSNISCYLELKVLEDSAKKSVNLSFAGVCSDKDNIIQAKNRDVNIKLLGSSDYLAFRALSLNSINFVGSITGGTCPGWFDKDFLFGEGSNYLDFSYCYRLGYNYNDDFYNSQNLMTSGLLLIKTSGSITMSAENI